MRNDERSLVVLHGERQGSPFWAYAMASVRERLAFARAAAAEGDVDFEAYGEILCWGEGSGPDDAARAFLRESLELGDE